eukprot:m.352921 g.352921  ORF g.352921 m.352921 type:complete len:535 (+) comp16647_c0_seq1:431-2035(+)
MLRCKCSLGKEKRHVFVHASVTFQQLVHAIEGQFGSNLELFVNYPKGSSTQLCNDGDLKAALAAAPHDPFKIFLRQKPAPIARIPPSGRSLDEAFQELHVSESAPAHVSASHALRPESPPPGYIADDHLVPGGKGGFVGVNGGGEFIPEAEHVQERQRSSSLHSLDSMRSKHSQGSVRSMQSVQSAHSGFSDTEAESAYGSQFSKGERYAADSVPRSMMPKPQQQTASQTFPRMKSAHSGAVNPLEHAFEDPQPTAQPPIPQGPPQEWMKGKLLGSGAFGEVYLAMDAQTGKELAVKQIPLRNMAEDNAKAYSDLTREISLFQTLNHKRIVQYYGTSSTETHINIFMEYLPGRSIAHRLREYGPFSVDVIRTYTRQILEGVQYLHSKMIVHRDIKGANVLADNAGNVKLADFGASRESELFQRHTQTVAAFQSIHGTPFWMAPEMVRGEGYGRRSDIWSVGCTVVEMASGSPPFSDCEPMAALFKIGSPDVDFRKTIPKHLPQTAQQFLEQCFTRNKIQRPTAEDLLRHYFMLQ